MDESLKEEFYSSIKEMILNITEQYNRKPQNLDILYEILAAAAALVALFVIAKLVKAFLRFRNRSLQKSAFKATLSAARSLESKGSLEGNGEGQFTGRAERNHLVDGDFFAAKMNSLVLEKRELMEIALKCEVLGAAVDKHTDRENNSKEVSSLVYRIALAMNLDRGTAAIYFCVGMVYDAGFLDLPSSLFYMKILSSKERRLIQSHVFRYQTHLKFIPEKYIGDFVFACMYHHENIDGTGYPEGLSGQSIPLVARIIRVAEAYTALASERGDYKKVNKRTALRELRKFPKFYDSAIVDILETFV